MAYRFRDIHDQLINEQIEYEEHTILLANIGQFFSGLGQSLVTGPMLAGKSLAEVTFKDEFILHSLTWTANEIAAYSGANSPNHVSVDPYEIPNISGEPESERLLLLITAFVFFTAADLAFEYFENQAEANLQDLVHQYDLIIPPLNRSVEYLNSSGAENAYNVGRSMYDKVINFRTHRPSYTNMTQYLGWGIDDPFGIATGDNSAAYFQYFLMGITEYLAYIDGLQSVDPNNSYSDLIVTMQGYIENLNQQSAQANWFNGAVYFESYSMGALGLSVMDQIDTHVFHQDGISIDLNLPNEVQSETLLAEIECYNYNGSINTANIIWNIEGTDLEGNFTNNGSGNYSAAIDVSSISDVAQASIYRLNIFAAVGAANVEGFRLFSVLPSTGIIHIVPDPGDMNAQDIGFQEFLSNNFSSQTISVSEFRYEVPNPALVPAIAIHNNSSTLPTYFSDSDFLASLTDYLDAGGNVVLFGNAVELLDVSGITNEMFNQYSNNHRIYITSVNHPITEEYSAGNYLSMGGNTYVSYVSAPDPTIGMVTLGYFYTSSINMLGEVPYGTGKVIFCGAATFTTPSNDFLGLATRIVDHSQNQGYASVRVDMDSAVPATQNEIFEIAVDVTAYGGALPIESVVSTLTMPADATLEYVTIGGESAETELGATLGTMNSGETQTVVYGVRCSTLGVKGFSVDITSTLIYSAYDYIEKVIHRPSATISDILVVNGGDAEHDALEAKLGWMGYSYTSVSVQDVIDNGISTSHKQVVIHNNTTSMPDAFLDGSFHDRLTDYLDAGGNVVLFGNAVELLDVSGITNEMFNQYSNNHRIYITSVNHPITEEYSAGNYLSMGGNTYVSYVSAPDPTIGMVTLGYFYTSSINMLGEVPYGTGKVIFCGAATFTTPSNDFLGLATRIVDYGQLRILRPMFELNGTEFPTNSQVDVTMRLYDEDSSLVTADSLESYYRDSEFNSFDVEFIESDSTGVYEASFLIEHDYPSGNYEIYVSAYKENMASGSGSVGFNVYSTLIVDSLLISYNLEPSVL
ncbi:MAG: hypothetical protein H8E26_00060, partial [FCB group bacterium]|nr:hypothetical protein [FCB group bacterium]